jgi:hypothetical protein
MLEVHGIARGTSLQERSACGKIEPAAGCFGIMAAQAMLLEHLHRLAR